MAGAQRFAGRIFRRFERRPRRDARGERQGRAQRLTLLERILRSFRRFERACRGLLSDGPRPARGRMQRPTNERAAQIVASCTRLGTLFQAERLLRRKLRQPRRPGVYPMVESFGRRWARRRRPRRLLEAYRAAGCARKATLYTRGLQLRWRRVRSRLPKLRARYRAHALRRSRLPELSRRAIARAGLRVVGWVRVVHPAGVEVLDQPTRQRPFPGIRIERAATGSSLPVLAMGREERRRHHGTWLKVLSRGQLAGWLDRSRVRGAPAPEDERARARIAGRAGKRARQLVRDDRFGLLQGALTRAAPTREAVEARAGVRRPVPGSGGATERGPRRAAASPEAKPADSAPRRADRSLVVDPRRLGVRDRSHLRQLYEARGLRLPGRRAAVCEPRHGLQGRILAQAEALAGADDARPVWCAGATADAKATALAGRLELHKRKSGALTLSLNQRLKIEKAAGFDPGPLTMHVDARAARLARSFGAKAFTVGRQTYYGDGQGQGDFADKAAIIAHESKHATSHHDAAGTDTDVEAEAEAVEAAYLARHGPGVQAGPPAHRAPRAPLVMAREARCEPCAAPPTPARPAPRRRKSPGGDPIERVMRAYGVRRKVDQEAFLGELSGRVLALLEEEIEAEAVRGAAFEGFVFRP